MENKIYYYLRPALFSLFFGFLLASFSQSCSSTKASISKYMSPVRLHTDNLSVKPVFKPLEERSFFIGTLDTPVKNKPLQTVVSDTTNYNKMILDNQQLSLLNEKKILELLMSKEKENKSLKQTNIKLYKKSEITQEEKENASMMTTLWDFGKYVLFLLMVIIVLLLVIIAIVVPKKGKYVPSNAS